MTRFVLASLLLVAALSAHLAAVTWADLPTGRIIIVGGRTFGDTPATPHSMAMFGSALPPFSDEVHGNSLSIVEDTVYSCGGYGSSNSYKKCWATDARPFVGHTLAWRSFDIPWELGFHSSVVVKNEIWFFLSSMLRIFDTRNPAVKFREFQMEFSFEKVTCAVAHGTKTFVIGVGEKNMEVYVNRDSSKPNQWDKFSTLLQGRGAFGCHVYQGEVFVTGGYVAATNTHLKSVEAFSVVDGTVRNIAPLGGVRADHKMAIIEGDLAVLGGHNGADAMATIETYDELEDEWETLGRTLSQPRFHFGLTQFLP